MSQRWRAVGNTVSNLTGPRFEPQTYRSKDERVNIMPKYSLHTYVPDRLQGIGKNLNCTKNKHSTGNIQKIVHSFDARIFKRI